jgi:putative two-component system response regulator
MHDGRMKWVHLRCNPVIDRSGRITQCYGTIQDITEMKQAEEELEEYSRHLEIKVEEKVKEISASQMATIYALVKLSESRDDDTGVHIERTAGFCRLLAEQARSIPRYAALMDDTFIETIFKASPLHDIGKVGIPDRILLKPGKLTGEEFEIMKTHVRIGYETLAKVGAQYQQNTFIKMGLDIVLYHHEKWNGSGYQAGLSGEQIPLSARIMAVADVYDALRSKRVYKEAFSHEKSVEIIAEGRGSHFDPLLIDLFLEHHEAFQSLYETMR